MLLASWPGYWLLPIVIGLHNLEEILWLPAWFHEHNQSLSWKAEPRQFRLAAGSLTLIPFLLATLMSSRGYGSLGHYLLAAYAIGQSMNIIMPHAVASLVTKSYMPGLGSGGLLVIPVTAVLVDRWLMAGQLRLPTLLLTCAIFIPLLLISIPAMFRLAELIPSLK